jgi:nicotinate-nucleotide--dimethylbenzimidazole phosphoribosyltransferase
MGTTAIGEYVSQIKNLDYEAMEKARARLDILAKPPGSLGKLEDIAVKLAGISGEMFYDINKRAVIIMSSDNGVIEEGVALTPQSVTYAQTVNFTRGLTGAAVIAKQFNSDLIVVDVGINADIDYIKYPSIINRKIRKSTNNIAKMPAMTYEEAETAILTGIETAIEAVRNGYKIIGIGEMGIGNTTTSSAVLHAFTNLPLQNLVGKGAGLSGEAYLHKIEVIAESVKKHRPDPSDPIDVLAKVGGFDIAAMAGVYIGCAYMRVPAVIDGFISVAAALTASKFNPVIKDYMLASHVSYEQGYTHAAATLGVDPALNLNMRLGEGSGCPIMFSVIDAACAVIQNMGTFEECAIDDRYTSEVKKGDKFTVKNN